MKTALTKLTAFFLVTLIPAAGIVIDAQTPKKPAPPSDVKIRQRIRSANDNGMETSLYVKGLRMRSEMAGNFAYTTIVQCDLKRTITINEKTRTYLVSSSDADPAMTAGEGDGGGAPAAGAAAAQTQRQPRGGVVDVVQTITDTGERKEMFGFTARHIKTSIVKKASPDACDKDQKIETDGWYIDFQYSFDCPGQTQKHEPFAVRPRPDCKDEIRTKTIGTARFGFPLILTTIIYQPDGLTTSTTQEVLELSREPLDAALFDVPAGYKLAKNMQELYGLDTSTYAGATTQPGNASGTSSNASSTANNVAGITSATTPKKPGVIRIGLIEPSVQMTAGDARQAAEALRGSFANQLNSPRVEVVLLSARALSSALDEARQGQCDYILSSSMTIKKGGGGSMFGRALGNIAGSAAAHIPVSSAGAAAARSAAVTGIYTTTEIASSIKARDEVTLSYKLEPLDQNKKGASRTEKAKATRDGEDVVAGLVQKSAASVVATVAP